MSAFFELKNINKRFGENKVAQEISFQVKCGEVFSILGPSGCGKTTILRMAGGFEEPDSGKVFLDEIDITNLAPNKRKINTVFQNYALFPHMSVRDNIAFGPRAAGVNEKEIAKKVDDMLALIRLGEHASKKPGMISGGEKQRVAIARALINNPKLLLLDEPLAALDLKLRQYMLLELDRIHEEVGTTFVYVTHDQSEAMSLSDRIAVMNQGRIEQIGTPAEIYETPATRFVASFIGDTNFFEGRIVSRINYEYCRIDMLGLGEFPSYNEHKLGESANITVSIRPEKFRIFSKDETVPSDLNYVDAEILDIVYQGSHTRYWVRSGNHRINVLRQHNRCYLDSRQPEKGNKIWLVWHKDDIITLADEPAKS